MANSGRAVQHLEWMRNFHDLYLRYGVAVSMGFIFATEVAALTFEKHGWVRFAFIALKLFELSLILSALGPIYFFFNLFMVGSWRCPQCGEKPNGWVAKGPKCENCGLFFYSR